MMREDSDTDYMPYKLVKGATSTQCPGIVSNSEAYNPNQLVLIRMPEGGPNPCSVVDYLDYNQEVEETLMTLFYVPSGRYLSFKKE